eukprot:869017-Rhodomonas_salina.1
MVVESVRALLSFSSMRARSPSSASEMLERNLKLASYDLEQAAVDLTLDSSRELAFEPARTAILLHDSAFPSQTGEVTRKIEANAAQKLEGGARLWRGCF